MKPELYDRVRELFLAVYELDPTARERFLDDHAGSPRVRAEVEELIAQHDDADAFMESTPPPEELLGAGRFAPSLLPQPGETIGPYVVRRVIGEGAFAIVCEADQQVPVRRTVALKILKSGMDTRRVIARFEAERQTLALMEHRFIAKVFDAGATDGGRPYFVMELVDGVPITSFCEANELSTAAREQLFVQVCEAIEHAHQKGIIHRDIKPSNVLVTIQGERTVPKVIDFGIAKATGPRLGAGTTFTERGQLVGTPAYMSPEQAGLGALDVDTRSDIYSLGALLYHMLVGVPPFDSERLRRAGPIEMQRTLCELEPPRPSARVAASGSDPSKQRALRREIQGDLDWIVLKSLEKDRARRYGTASEFAADVRRHLTMQAVTAGPPRRWYRFSRFARRHKVGLAAGMLVFLALVAGTVGIGWERAQAEKHAATAGETIEMLGELLGALRAGRNPRAVIDRPSLAELARDTEQPDFFPERPRVRARIFSIVAYAYESLDLPALAEPHLKRALEIRAAEGPTEPLTLRTMVRYAALLMDLRRPIEAERVARGVLEIATATDLQTRAAASAASVQLAAALGATGRSREAERRLRRAVNEQRELLGAEHDSTLASMAELAALLSRTGRSDEALALLREIAEHNRESHGPRHERTLAAVNAVARELHRRGDLDEAARLLADSVDVPGRAASMDAGFILAEVEADRGDLVRAESRHEICLERRRNELGMEHRDTLRSAAALIRARVRAGHLEAADETFDQVAGYARPRGEGDAIAPERCGLMVAEAELYAARGQPGAAEAAFRRALAFGATIGMRSESRLAAAESFGGWLLGRERASEAETLLRDTLGDAGRAESPRVKRLAELWGRSLRATGHSDDEAERLISRR